MTEHEHHGLVHRLVINLKGARSMARIRAKRIEQAEGEAAEALLAAKIAIERTRRAEGERNAFRAQATALAFEIEYLKGKRGGMKSTARVPVRWLVFGLGLATIAYIVGLAWLVQVAVKGMP